MKMLYYMINVSLTMDLINMGYVISLANAFLGQKLPLCKMENYFFELTKC